MAAIEQSGAMVYFDETFQRVDFDKIKPRYVLDNSDAILSMPLWQHIACFLDTQSAITLRLVSLTLYNISLHLVPLTVRSVQFKDEASISRFKLLVSQLKENEQLQIESITLPSDYMDDVLYMHVLQKSFEGAELLKLAAHAPHLTSITNVLKLESSNWGAFNKAYNLSFSLIRHLDLTNVVPLAPYPDHPGQFLFWDVTYYLRLFLCLQSLNLQRSSIVTRHSFHDLEKKNLAFLQHVNLSYAVLGPQALQRLLRYAFHLVTLNLRHAGGQKDDYAERNVDSTGIQDGFELVCKDQFPQLIEVDVTGTDVSIKDVTSLLLAAPALSILRLPQTAEMDRFLAKMSQEIYARFDKLYYNDVLITPKKFALLQSYLNTKREVKLRASL